MLRIGLTGGIASGKTTVANLFSELGVPIIDADVIARELTAPGRPLTDKIIQQFGQRVVQPQSSNDTQPMTLGAAALDRAQLRTLVFNDPAARQWLEAQLHPAIRQTLQAKMAALPKTTPYCIAVIPLLAEIAAANRPFSGLDRILVVDSDPNQQRQRLQTRDQISADLANQMIANQASREARLQLADDVIENQGDLTTLRDAVAALDKRYRLMATLFRARS